MSFGTPHVFQQQNKISNSLSSKHRCVNVVRFNTYLIVTLCRNGVCNRHLVFNQSATEIFLEKTNMYRRIRNETKNYSNRSLLALGHIRGDLNS